MNLAHIAQDRTIVRRIYYYLLDNQWQHIPCKDIKIELDLLRRHYDQESDYYLFKRSFNKHKAYLFAFIERDGHRVKIVQLFEGMIPFVKTYGPTNFDLFKINLRSYVIKVLSPTNLSE